MLRGDKTKGGKTDKVASAYRRCLGGNFKNGYVNVPDRGPVYAGMMDRVPIGHRTSFPLDCHSPSHYSFLAGFLVPFFFFFNIILGFSPVAICLLSHSISIVHRTPRSECVFPDLVPINSGSLAVLSIASLFIYPHHLSTLPAKISTPNSAVHIAVLQKDGQLFVGRISRGV